MVHRLRETYLAMKERWECELTNIENMQMTDAQNRRRQEIRSEITHLEIHLDLCARLEKESKMSNGELTEEEMIQPA